MLKRIGFDEIFLPKIFPSRVNFRSANVDYSQDGALTIPADDLARLNAIDWYSPQPREVWQLASRYFDIAFFIVDDFKAATNLLNDFEGAAIWRTYGLDSSLTYTRLGQSTNDFEPAVIKARSRFWFGQAYPNLVDVESDYLQRRSVYLPLGMPDVSVQNAWRGGDARILFVCPDLGFNAYYQDVYAKFRRNFSGLPYVIGGTQPVTVNDPNVLGFLSAEEYARNMRELQVMFYHSQEPRHIHYHPFEAIRAGMPVIFMAGGMLDKMGGIGLPGRAKTIAEARRKVARILGNDRRFIDDVRQSQTVLLDAMSFESMVPQWQTAMDTVVDKLDAARAVRAPVSRRRKRVALIVPVGYRGGTLRGTKLLAKAVAVGSARAGEPVDVVIAHLDDRKLYAENTFADLHPGVKARPFSWVTLNKKAAKRAMLYAGSASWIPPYDNYYVPDDGIQQLGDCDLWVVMSDRLSLPLLPVRPYVMMVYDYLQRYVPIMPNGADNIFLHAARNAKRVLVTTDFTRADAIDYAGVSALDVRKVPMLAPELDEPSYSGTPVSRSYFLWSTNAAPHKNHATAMAALSDYYAGGGNLDCVVTGVDTRGLIDDSTDNLRAAAQLLGASRALKQRLKVVGELDDLQYRAALKGAVFLWHPGTIDNGTFSVVEAARLGVPSLSSNYPAMREIDRQFKLNLAFSPSDDVTEMAARLKWMQDNAEQQRALVPDAGTLAEQSVENLADAYWAQLREFL